MVEENASRLPSGPVGGETGGVAENQLWYQVHFSAGAQTTRFWGHKSQCQCRSLQWHHNQVPEWCETLVKSIGSWSLEMGRWLQCPISKIQQQAPGWHTSGVTHHQVSADPFNRVTMMDHGSVEPCSRRRASSQGAEDCH